MFYFLDDRSRAEIKQDERENGKLKRKRSSSVDNSSGKGAPVVPRKSNTVGIFTTFEKCDSLLYFPDSFVACVNSADFTSLSKLMRSRINHHCELTLMRQRHSLPTFLKLFELMDDLHPDFIMHIHTTKVVKNQVRAKIYFKFTESRPLRNAIAKSTKDPLLLMLCPTPEKFLPKFIKNMEHESEEERQGFIEFFTNAEELVVYGSSLMSITFEAYSKHITHFELRCEPTSFSAVPTPREK